MSEPTTVRVRIAVAVNEHGEWHAHGDHRAAPAAVSLEAWANTPATDAMALSWVEASVPLPVRTVVEGVVVEDK